MRIAVIGGGPGGLYFAILAKAWRPDLDITVFERNRPEDTFGFGVVFSDATLDTFERHDPESYRAITETFAYWDDVVIKAKGVTHRVPGNGFCGCSRVALLNLLADRARRLGVGIEHGVEIAPDLAALAGHDLIVAADGINSRIREAHPEHFQPEVDLRPNRFSWMGSTKPLDGFTFIFKETAHGIFIAHAYQYEAGRSTWVMETDPGTFARVGLEEMSEEAAARYLEGVFAEDLEGHRLITNRSLWRRFPMIRTKRWVRDNVALVGDAKATAHFSIGSGTKLAMEDAIALFEALKAKGAVGPALAAYETGRRSEVERTQHAADVSLVWFEHVARFWDLDPRQFAFGLMTRSKAITLDNLKLRAPDFADATTAMFAGGVAAGGLEPRLGADGPAPPAFQPFRLREMRLANRLVLSPMCLYDAEDGLPGDFHLVHYGSRALGGAGLLFTEMTCVAPDARITPGCAGLWSDAQEAAWTRIVDFVHGRSTAKIALQLGHAGRKGATRLMWEGMDRPLPAGGWDLVSASPIPYHPDSQIPRELDEAGMAAITADFVASVERAARCGFDMVELHCAHGYLLSSFLSPLTNRRTDSYGGSVGNRLRFPLAVFRAMRAAWPEDKPMSVRLSATEWAEGGITEEDLLAIVEAFRAAGCDLIDVSTGQTVAHARPVYGRMFQTPYADLVRNEAGIATMCVGSITTADQANTILAAGRADLVALGRPHLTDPAFTLHAAAWYGVDLPVVPNYAPGKDALYRNAAKDRADLDALKRAAKPKRHAKGALQPASAAPTEPEAPAAAAE